MLLYKYASMIGAEKILDSVKIRYSAPEVFNDPFDTQVDDLHPLGIFDDEVKSTEFLLKLLKSDREIIKKPYNNYDALILLKSLFSSVSDKEIEKIIQEERSVLPSGKKNDRYSEFLSTIKSHFKNDAITCFSNRLDVLPMWAHYAENSKGAVLGFNPNPTYHLASTEKVIYSKIRPLVYYSLEDYFEKSLFRDHMEFVTEYVHSIWLTKYIEWEYENEYRVIISDKIPSGESHIDLSFDEKELESIYFGVNADETYIRKISAMAIKLNPEISLYRMARKRTSFELTPELIN